MAKEIPKFEEIIAIPKFEDIIADQSSIVPEFEDIGTYDDSQFIGQPAKGSPADVNKISINEAARLLVEEPKEFNDILDSQTKETGRTVSLGPPIEVVDDEGVGLLKMESDDSKIEAFAKAMGQSASVTGASLLSGLTFGLSDVISSKITGRKVSFVDEVAKFVGTPLDELEENDTKLLLGIVEGVGALKSAYKLTASAANKLPVRPLFRRLANTIFAGETVGITKEFRDKVVEDKPIDIWEVQKNTALLLSVHLLGEGIGGAISKYKTDKLVNKFIDKNPWASNIKNDIKTFIKASKELRQVGTKGQMNAWDARWGDKFKLATDRMTEATVSSLPKGLLVDKASVSTKTPTNKQLDKYLLKKGQPYSYQPTEPFDEGALVRPTDRISRQFEMAKYQERIEQFNSYLKQNPNNEQMTKARDLAQRQLDSLLVDDLFDTGNVKHVEQPVSGGPKKLLTTSKPKKLLNVGATSDKKALITPMTNTVKAGVLRRTKSDMKMGTEQYKSLASDTIGKVTPSLMTDDEVNKLIDAMKKTDPERNNLIDNWYTRSKELDTPLLDNSLDIRAAQERFFEHQLKQIKRANHKKETLAKKGKDYNYFSYYAPKRLAVADFEYNTGIPVIHLDHSVTKKSKIIAHKIETEFGKILSNAFELSDKEASKAIRNIIGNTTVESNERIANYLYSEESRAKVVENMSEEEIKIAERLDNLMQNGEMAIARMEESMRFWLDMNKKPFNIDDIMPKEMQKNILTIAEAARDVGELRQFVRSLFNQGIKFGLRKYYYMSEGKGTTEVEEYIKSMSSEPLEPPHTTKAKPPSLIGKETMPRKGDKGPKSGSVYNNIMNSWKRVEVRNAVDKELRELYNRYNQVELSDKDKKYLEELYSRVLLKGELSVPPHDFLAKMNAAFWRAYLSPITNTTKAVRAVARNALQTVAEAGNVVNTKEFYKNAKIISKKLIKGESLDSIDVQMQEDFTNSFEGYVSNRASIYRDALFIDLGQKAAADNLPKKALELIKYSLDVSGSGYVGVDTINRMVAWLSHYKTVMDAGMSYLNNDISYEQFCNKTYCDTMMSPAQTNLVNSYLSAGDVRAAANYLADTRILDMHRGYSSIERAGVERTRSQRSLIGIYTYPRGTYDNFYNGGIRPLIEGVKEGNTGKAKRAAFNIAEGLFGRTITNSILTGLGFGSLYSLWRVMYTPLQPSLSIMGETLVKLSRIGYEVSSGRMSYTDAIKDSAEIIYEGADDIVHFLPDIEFSDNKSSKNKRAERPSRPSK